MKPKLSKRFLISILISLSVLFIVSGNIYADEVDRAQTTITDNILNPIEVLPEERIAVGVENIESSLNFKVLNAEEAKRENTGVMYILDIGSTSNSDLRFKKPGISWAGPNNDYETFKQNEIFNTGMTLISDDEIGYQSFSESFQSQYPEAYYADQYGNYSDNTIIKVASLEYDDRLTNSNNTNPENEIRVFKIIFEDTLTFNGSETNYYVSANVPSENSGNNQGGSGDTDSGNYKDLPKKGVESWWYDDTSSYRVISYDKNHVSNTLDKSEVFGKTSWFYIDDPSITKVNYEDILSTYETSFKNNYTFQTYRSNTNAWYNVSVPIENLEKIIIKEGESSYYGLTFKIGNVSNDYGFNGMPEQDGNVHYNVQVKGAEIIWESGEPITHVTQWQLSEDEGTNKSVALINEYLSLDNEVLELSKIEELNSKARDKAEELTDNYTFSFMSSKNFADYEKNKFNPIDIESFEYSESKTKERNETSLDNLDVVFKVNTGEQKYYDDQDNEIEFYFVIQRNHLTTDPYVGAVNWQVSYNSEESSETDISERIQLEEKLDVKSVDDLKRIADAKAADLQDNLNLKVFFNDSYGDIESDKSKTFEIDEVKYIDQEGFYSIFEITTKEKIYINADDSKPLTFKLVIERERLDTDPYYNAIEWKVNGYPEDNDSYDPVNTENVIYLNDFLEVEDNSDLDEAADKKAQELEDKLKLGIRFSVDYKDADPDGWLNNFHIDSVEYTSEKDDDLGIYEAAFKITLTEEVYSGNSETPLVFYVVMPRQRLEDEPYYHAPTTIVDGQEYKATNGGDVFISDETIPVEITSVDDLQEAASDDELIEQLNEKYGKIQIKLSESYGGLKAGETIELPVSGVSYLDGITYNSIYDVVYEIRLDQKVYTDLETSLKIYLILTRNRVEEDPYFNAVKWQVTKEDQSFTADINDEIYLTNESITFSSLEEDTIREEAAQKAAQLESNYNLGISFDRDYEEIQAGQFLNFEIDSIAYDPDIDFGDYYIPFKVTLNQKIATESGEIDEFYLVIKRTRLSTDPKDSFTEVDQWGIVKKGGSVAAGSETGSNLVELTIRLVLPEGNKTDAILSHLTANYPTLAVRNWGSNPNWPKAGDGVWYVTNTDVTYTLNEEETSKRENQYVFDVEPWDEFVFKAGNIGRLRVIVTIAEPLDEAAVKEFTVSANEPDNVKMNLFDYWNNDNDPSNEVGNPWYGDPTFSYASNGGINTNHYLKFLYSSQTSQNDANNTTLGYGIWNHSVEAARENVKGLVENKLVSDFPKLRLNTTNSGSIWDDFTMSTGQNLVDYPTLNSDESYRTESLDYLFDPEVTHPGKASYSNVTGLLQMNQEGYYYYDSKLNYATFDEEDNEFTLYNTWGVHPSGQSPNGQFFPFNTIDDAFDGIETITNEDGTQEKALVHNADNSRSEKYNHHFGYTMEVDFQQPISGVINHGADEAEPMTFKFAGDDDIWVFIDDVLVLDMGGLHSGIYGEINFATGEIITGTMSQEIESGAELGGTNWVRGTTIRSRFENAEASDTTAWGNGSRSNTFADGTVHTLKLFYMERGHWDSNFAMYFNLQKPIDHQLFKFDEDGEPLGEASFSLYEATIDGNAYISPSDTTWYTSDQALRGEAILEDIITSSEGDIGYTDLVAENISLTDFAIRAARDRKNIYILHENSSPSGYKLLEKDIILRYDPSNNTFKVLNRYEIGAYSSFTAILEDNMDELYYATSEYVSYNGRNELFIRKSVEDDSIKYATQYETITDDHKRNALLFAVPMAYTSIDGEYGWYPAYGSNRFGYHIVDMYSAEEFFKSAEAWKVDEDTGELVEKYPEGQRDTYEAIQESNRWALRHNLLATVLRQAADPEIPDWYFRCEEVSNSTNNKDVSTVRFTAELHNLPGDASRYLVNSADNNYGDVNNSDIRLVGLLVDAEALASFMSYQVGGYADTATKQEVIQENLEKLLAMNDIEKYEYLQEILNTTKYPNPENGNAAEFTYQQIWDYRYNQTKLENNNWEAFKEVLNEAYISSQENTKRERGINLAYIDNFTQNYSSVIYVPNEKAQLQLLKEDVEGKPLPGAEFALYYTARDADSDQNRIVSGITDESGIISFENVDLTDKPETFELGVGIANIDWYQLAEDAKKIDNDNYFWIREVNSPPDLVDEQGKPLRYEVNDSLIKVVVDNNGVHANASAYYYDTEEGKAKLIDSDIESITSNPDEATLLDLKYSGKYNTDNVYVLANPGKLYQSMKKFADKNLNETLLGITTTANLNFTETYDLDKSEVWNFIEGSKKDYHYWGDEFQGLDYSLDHQEATLDRNRDFYKTENGFIKLNIKQSPVETFMEYHDDYKEILSKRREDITSIEDLSGVFSALNIVVVQDFKLEEISKIETTPGKEEIVNVGDEVSYNINWNRMGEEETELKTVTITDPLDPGVDFMEAKYREHILKDSEEFKKDDSDILEYISADQTVQITYDPELHTVTWKIEGEALSNRSVGEVYLRVKVNENAYYEWSHDKPELNDEVKDNTIYNRALVAFNDNEPEITGDVENPLPNEETGILKIHKDVIGKHSSGIEPSDTFKFKLSLYEHYDPLDPESEKAYLLNGRLPVSYEDEKTTLHFSDGVAIFELEKDKTITIKDIPVGIEYVLEEIDSHGFDVEFVENSNIGRIDTDDQIIEINVVNKLLGSLTITKVLDEEQGELPEEIAEKYKDGFEFIVELEDKTINGTFGSVEFTNGKSALIKLKHGEMITIPGLPAGITYKVIEQGQDELIENGVYPKPYFTEGVIKENEVVSTAYINQVKTDYGTLSITKIATGEDIDSDTKFYFELFLTKEDKNNEVQNVVIKDLGNYENFNLKEDESGKYTFTLTPGDKITITGLPLDTIYKVFEVGENLSDQFDVRYYPSSNNGEYSEGILTDTTEVAVVVQNISKNNTVLETGRLEVKKLVDSKDSQYFEIPFEFGLKLFGYSEPLSYEIISDVTSEEDNDENTTTDNLETKEINSSTGLYEFSLKHGESIIFYDIPEDTIYQVIEKVNDNFTSVITEGKDIGQIIRDNQVVVEFTNTPVSVEVGSLIIGKFIYKEDITEEELSQEFSFDLTLYGLSDEDIESIIFEQGSLNPEVQGTSEVQRPNYENGVFKFTLHHNETLVISNIPVGTIYNVIETNSLGYISSLAEGSNERIGEIEPDTVIESTNPSDDESQEDVITEVKQTQVIFKNTLPETKTGSIIIGKEIKKENLTNEEKDLEFTFNLQLINVANPNDIGLSFSKGNFDSDIASFEGLDPEEFKFDDEGILEFKLKHDESLLIRNIPVGTAYFVTETKSLDYEASLDYSYSSNIGSITEEAIEEPIRVKFINTPPEELKIPHLLISKSHSYGSESKDYNQTTINNVAIDGIIDFKIDILNNGEGTAHNLEVYDYVPDYLNILPKLEEPTYTITISDKENSSNSEDVTSDSSYSVDENHNIKFVIPELGPEKIASIEFSVQVIDDQNRESYWLNHAYLKYDEMQFEDYLTVHMQRETEPEELIEDQRFYCSYEHVNSEISYGDLSVTNSDQFIENAGDLLHHSITNNLDTFKYSNDVAEYLIRTYNPVSVPIQITKTYFIDGNPQIIESGEFAFRITPNKDNPQPDPLGLQDEAEFVEVTTGEVNLDIENIIELNNLEFTETGFYSYTVEEVKPDEDDGISYDSVVYTINITVEIDGQNLKANVTVNNTKDRVVDEDSNQIVLPFINTKNTEITTGQLTISKLIAQNENDEVLDEDKQIPFKIDIKLLDEAENEVINKSYEAHKFNINEVEINEKYVEDESFDPENHVLRFNEDGIATTYLKHGDIIKLPALPLGYRYQVSEDLKNTGEGLDNVFYTNITGEEGTITTTASHAAITNIYYVNQLTGELVISKLVGSRDENDKAQKFRFNVQLRFAENTFEENSEPSYVVFPYVISNPNSEENITGEIFFDKATGSLIKVVPDKELTSGNETGAINPQIEPDTFIILGHQDTITITGLPIGTEYEVYEALSTLATFVNESTDNKGVITKERSSAHVSFVNIPIVPTSTQIAINGSLRINKITGEHTTADPNKEFRIKITLDNEDLQFNGEYGDVTFENNVGYANIHFGESVYVRNIPFKTYYIVEEIDNGGYSSEIINGSGWISLTTQQSTQATVIVKNTAPDPSETAGGLEVTKNVLGSNIDPNAEFRFKVTLDNDQINSIPEDRYGQMLFESGVAEFTLKQGETISAENLPAGTTYTVEELTQGYNTIYSGDVDANKSGQIVANTVKEVFVTNHKDDPNKGNLVVGKVVGGSEGDQNKEFEFTVSLEDTTINGTYGEMNFVNGVAKFTLKHGETKVARGLPENLAYKITEESDGYTITYPENGFYQGRIKVDSSDLNLFVNTKGNIDTPEEPEDPKQVKTETDPGAGSTVEVGRVITYRIDWTNPKNDTAEIVIVDKLDEGVDFKDASNNGVYDPQTHTVTWNLGQKAAKATGSVELRVIVNEKALTGDSTIENTAGVQVDNETIIETNTVENPAKPKVKNPVKREVKPGEGKLVTVGEKVSYQIDYFNTEKDPATITIKDKLDPGVNFSSASFDNVVLKANTDGTSASVNENGISITYDRSSHTVTWRLENRPGYEENTVDLEVIVNENAYFQWNYENPNLDSSIQDNQIINRASVQVNDNPEVETPDITNPLNQNRVIVEKYHKLTTHNRFHTDDNFLKVGDTVYYEIIVTNTRREVAEDVVLEDPVPALMTVDKNSFTGNYLIQTAKVNNILSPQVVENAQGTLITWYLGNLEPNEKVTIQFAVKVGDPKVDEAWWINHAYLTYKNIADEPEFNMNANSIEEFVEIFQTEEVMAAATAFPSTEQNRVDHDSLYNAGLQLGTPVYHSYNIPDGIYRFTADVREYIAPEEEVINPSITKAQQVDNGKITSDDQIVTRGSTLTYFITVNNPSGKTLNNVTVSDIIPAGLSYVEGSASNNGRYTNGSIYWNLSTLAPNEEITLSFKVIVSNDPIYIHWENTAVLDWEDNPENPIPSNKVITDTPQLDILKEQATVGTQGVDRTSGYIEFKPGDVVTYYITVTNTSNVPSTNTVITDRIPSGLVLLEGSASEGVEVNGDLLTWNIGVLQPGQKYTVRVTFSCQLPEIIEEEIYFRNTAYVSWDENLPNNPEASNEVIIGDPPTNTDPETPSNSNNNNSNNSGNNVDTSTKPAVVTNTTTSSTTSSVGVSPKTGVTGGIAVFALTGVAAALTLVEKERRLKKRKKRNDK